MIKLKNSKRCKTVISFTSLLILTTVFLGVLSLVESVGLVALEGIAGFLEAGLPPLTSTMDLLLTVVSMAEPLLEEEGKLNKRERTLRTCGDNGLKMTLLWRSHMGQWMLKCLARWCKGVLLINLVNDDVEFKFGSIQDSDIVCW